MSLDLVAGARKLLGRSPDAVEPIVVWGDRVVYRVRLDDRKYLIKTDPDREIVAREAFGLRRAAEASIPVPELIAVTEDALAMTWDDGVALHQHSTRRSWRDTGAKLRRLHDLGGSAPFGAGFGGSDPAHRSWREFFETFTETMLNDCARVFDFSDDQANRIRTAVQDRALLLDAPHVGWCHGDLQPEHVLIDPETERVASIIDWSDHGSGDAGWDVAVLILDHDAHIEDLLDGYDASTDLRQALTQLLPVYRVVRLLGEAHWLTVHHHPEADNSLRRAIAWRHLDGQM